MKKTQIRILTAILLLNPISILFLSIFGISIYGFLLVIVCLFGIAKGLKEYVIQELGPYLEPSTLLKIKEFRIYEPPVLEKEKKATFGIQFLLIPLLFVYLWTRIITFAILSFFQLIFRFLISLGPILDRIGHTLFRFIASQTKLLKHVMDITIIPVFKFFVPAIEYCIELTIKTCLYVHNYWKMNGKRILSRLKELSDTSFALWLHYSTFFVRFMYRFGSRIWNDDIIPMWEQTKQIMIQIYPKIKKGILGIFAICEYLDDQLRPVLMPIFTFFWIQTRLVILVFWNSAGILFDSLFAIISLPFKLFASWISFCSTMMAQVARRIGRYALIAYEFSKPHIIRYYHQLRKAVLLIKNQLLIWFYKYKIPTKFHQLKKALAFTFEEVRLWIDLLVISIHQLYTQLYQQSFALFHSLIGHFQ